MKKLSLWLVVLSMMMSLLPQTMVSAENEWYDIEVEAGTCDGNMLTKIDSDRKYMYTVQGTSSALSTTSTFTSAEGDYDIWAVVGAHPNGHWLSSYTFSVDGTSFDKICAKAAYAEEKALYTMTYQVAGGFNMTFVWAKVAEDVSLSAGEHSLVSEITGATGNGNKFGAMDMVRVVPAEWEWIPEANFEDPYDMSSIGGGNDDDEEDDDITGDGDDGDEVVGDNDPTVDGYIHAEAENASFFADAYSVHTREEASSGKVLVPKDSANPDDTAVEFNVTIPETTGYDVYALVALKDFSSSTWRLMVDGVSYDQQMNVGAGQIYEININLGYPRKMHWVKMAGNIELEEGDATVVAHLPTKTHIDSGSWLTAIDAIRLVPTNWFWAPNASYDVPVKKEISNTTNEDGTLLIEAENGIMSGSMNKVSYANASDGAYASVKSTSTAGNVKLDFKTLEEETYDIWAAIATNPVNWLGGYVFTLDDTEIYNKCLLHVDTSNPDLYGQTVVLHTGNSSASASTIRWVKIGEKQTLSAGDHEIVAGTRGGSGVNNSTGLIDCIAFVPSSWKWTGSDSLELPEKPEVIPDDGEDEPIVPEPGEVITTDWFDIEVETGTAASGTLRVHTAGDKKYMSAAQSVESALAVTNAFATEKAGTYDIWAVVGTHSGGNNLGSYTFTLDDVVLASNISAGSPTYDSANVLYTGVQVAQGYPISMVWTKVAEDVELAEGTHTLVSEITKAPSNSNKFGAIDVVSFIPSGWNLKGKNPISKQLVDAVVAKYFKGDYSAITENIELPTEIPVIAGTTISYECDDASVIATDGTVTRPYFNEEDANVNFNVVANFGSGKISSSIPMTVLKNTKYTVEAFETTEDLVANGEFMAMANVKVNADAKSGISGKASIVIALYNADGTLADIATECVTVTTAGVDVGTGIVLPENVSGKTVKVYLLNGFEMGNQLIETVVVK